VTGVRARGECGARNRIEATGPARRRTFTAARVQGTRRNMREWLYHHEYIIFIAIMLVIVIAGTLVMVGAKNNVTDRTWHYQCYSGGVLVIDQEYPLNGLGNALDPETHERVYFKGMDCVVTR